MFFQLSGIGETAAAFDPLDLSNATLSNEYVSAAPGAINSTLLSWQANYSGAYEIRKAATGCGDGAVLEQGNAAANVLNVSASIAATELVAGSNQLYLCFEDNRGNRVSQALTLVRDDDPPAVTVTPAGGSFGVTVPGISVACNDVGAAGCEIVACTNNGTDPAFSVDGTIAAGWAYSGAFSGIDAAITEYRFLPRDRAGNTALAIVSRSFTVDTTVATLTPGNVSDTNLAAGESASITWQSDRDTPYEVRVGGTDCSTGTSAATGTATANTDVVTAIGEASFPGEGSNTVRICAQNLTGAFGVVGQSISVDRTAPGISSSTPSHLATAVDPYNTTILINFSENMDTSLAPSPTFEVLAATYETLAIPNVSVSWATATTLRIDFGAPLPELASLRWNIAESELKDVAGNSVPGVSGTVRSWFTTDLHDGYPVTDTNQTACHNTSGASLSCASVRHDGSFPNTPNALGFGPPSAPNASYPGDAVTYDALTTLSWTTCARGQTYNGTTCSVYTDASYFNWTGALDACYALNTIHSGAGYAGLQGWRLPTLSEMQTMIVVYDNDRMIPDAYFPNAAQDNSRMYWTATTRKGRLDRAWKMHTYASKVQYDDKSDTHLAICVRGTPASFTGGPGPYTANGNGTVTDASTGLVWQKCSGGQGTSGANFEDCASGTPGALTWQGALDYCDGLSLAGRSWRLPGIKELHSIVDNDEEQPSINATYFPNTMWGASVFYWSSTTHPSSTLLDTAMVQDFELGTSDNIAKSTSANMYVRCVSGP
jgi:hypothetical protein